MQDRLRQISEQLSFRSLSGLAKLRVQRDDDVVVCGAVSTEWALSRRRTRRLTLNRHTLPQVRSPLGKANSGSLKDTAPDMLLHQVLKGLVERAGVDPAAVEARLLLGVPQCSPLTE